ncbi:MAG: putative haloacid dehalogenase-like hydrolase family protein, partial [Thermoleophilia bacterium]|nr:putative haloacid dehalogenase-like hydrolase family protein [Thermoleophilia bacterium]
MTPTSTALNLTANFTVETWFRTSDITSGTSQPALFSRQQDSTIATNYELYFDKGTSELCFMFTQGNGVSFKTICTPSGPWVNGVWHHAAGTYDGTTMRLYVDGVQRASLGVTGPADTPNQPLALGFDNVDNVAKEFFHGDLDDARLSSVARSGASVAATYAAGAPFANNFAEYGMNQPAAVAVDGSGSVYVADTYMNRVTRWATRPTVNGQSPTNYLWKAPVGSGSTPNVRWSWAYGPISMGTNNPAAVAVAGDGASLRIAVGDSFDHRIVLLTKNEAALADSDFGTAAYGQASLTTNSGGSAADQLGDVGGVWTDGTNSIVSDPVNHRVLLFNSFPTTNGSHPAVTVLGQSGYGVGNTCANNQWNGSSCGNPSSPSRTSMANPQGVFYDGTYLYVADHGNNRVLVWNGWPATDGKPADFVLGQPDFTTTSAGSTNTKMYGPIDVSVKGVGAARRIAVLSETNSKVMIFNDSPTTGMAATDVLGQSAYGSSFGQANRGQATATADSLRSPKGLDYDPSTGDLYIADTMNHRVVRYPSAAQVTGSSADLVLGHAGPGAMTTAVPLDAVNVNHFTTQTLGAYGLFAGRVAYTPTGKLLAANYDEGTVALWNTPTTIDTPFDLRWGQSARTNAGGNGPGNLTANPTKIKYPGHIWSDGTRLLVPDSGNNRVLYWNHLPTSDTDPPNNVLGQPNFTSGLLGSANNQMTAPGGVTSDGRDVYVADTNNDRVLVFRNFIASPSNGPTADVVLGGSGAPSATTLNTPRAISVLQDQLVVVDRNNYRIAVWNGVQTVATGTPMDAVIGQSNFTNNGGGTATGYVEGVTAVGGAVLWAASAGVRMLDPIPRSGAILAAGIATVGDDTVGYLPAPTQSSAAFPGSISGAAGKIWVGSAGFGRLQRWSDVITPVPAGVPTATAACDGTVTVTWSASESTQMTVRWGSTSLGSWGAGYPNEVIDSYPFTGQPRYAGLVHSTALDVPTAGTYYARVQLADWAGNTPAPSAEISFVVPPTCPAPTTMLADDLNAQAGTGRANPSTTSTPPIKSPMYHSSWRNVAGVTMDRFQTQTWTTPPEDAGGVWHLNASTAADPNGRTSNAV